MTRHFVILRTLACVILTSGASTGWAATQVLYDPSAPGLASFEPAAAGWLSGGSFGSVSASADAQGVAVTQVGNGNTVGYSNYSPLLAFVLGAPLVNPAFPQLNRVSGYRFTFGLELVSEAHSGNSNRAGFSVTLISADPLHTGERKGIEIGFQSDRVFAQNDGSNGTGIFTAGEINNAVQTIGAEFSPNRWNLDVQGDTYSLSLAASGGTVLSGALRDYRGSGKNAYLTENFLFVGDNTSSASADFRFSYAAITTPIPEPHSYAMLIAGLALFGALVQRRRCALA